MSKKEKLIARLITCPRDFKYDEAKTLLSYFGYTEYNKGRTSGSRVEFVNSDHTILLHKPHPSGDLKTYQVKQLIAELKSQKLI